MNNKRIAQQISNIPYTKKGVPHWDTLPRSI